MSIDLGPAIRAAREAAGLEAQELALRLGLTKSQMSKIESGQRSVKAAEVIDIAEALGISPRALVRPQSTSGQVAYAARTMEAVTVQQSMLLDRLRGIVDLVDLLPSTTATARAWSSKPIAEIDHGRFVASATAMAAWGRMSVGPVNRGSTRFVSIAEALAKNLGIDVLVERFVDETGQSDAMLGGAVVHDDLHLIAINATSRRVRALFTLAHELGHVLQGEGVRISQDASFDSKTDEERFANAFAAAFLLSEEDVDRVLTEHGRYLPDTVASLMRDFDVARQTAVYRLHNLRRIDARTRDQLLAPRPWSFASLVRDPELSDFVSRGAGEYIADRAAQPTTLISRTLDAYRTGAVSATPLASLLGVTVDEVIDQYGQADDRATPEYGQLVDPWDLVAADEPWPDDDYYDDPLA